MKYHMMLLTVGVTVNVLAAPLPEEMDAAWRLAPRTPWVTEAREVMNLGGPGSEWKATYTRAIMGEFIKMAGAAKICRWTDEPVDETNAKWVPVKLPRLKFASTDWRCTVGYYERTVTLTESQAARNVRICFEAIGVHYKVWVNGKLAVNIPQSSSFLEQHDISAFVRPGVNTLRVMVGDKIGENDCWVDWPINGCKHDIVRPFYLEFRDKIAIENVTVRTQVTPEKVLAVRVCVTNMTNASVARDVNVKVEGEQWSVSGSVELKPGEGKVVELKKPWPEAHLWSPDDPYLYNLKVALHCQTPPSTSDAYRVRFGFREVRWIGTDHRAVLNGKPFVMLRNTTARPGFDPEKNRAMIKLLRSRGIVGYRYWTGDYQDLARFCDVCDEQGFLVATCAGSAWGAGKKTDVFWPRWKRMLGKMMKQCMNAPSIVCWGISNEFGTVYGGCDNMESAVKQGEVGEWVQAQDPTRPWECYGEIELRWHGKEGPMPIRSYHYPVGVAGTVLPQGGRWYADGGFGCWQGVFTNDKPVSVSEDLYHGFQDTQPTTAKALVGDRVYTLEGYTDACWYVLRNFCEGYLLGGVAAWDPWCFCVEREENQLFNGPRGSPHPNHLIMIREHCRNLTAGKTTQFALVVLNCGFSARKGMLVRTITVDGKAVGPAESVRMDLDAGEKRELQVQLPMPLVKKITLVKVTYTWKGDDGAKIAETAFDFMSVPPMAAESIKVRGAVAAIVTKTNSVLPKLSFANGVHAKVEAALKTEPKAVVVNGPLLPQEAQLLDDWVKEGGKVLQLEPERTDWSVATLPSAQTAGRFRYSFSFRRDDNHMKAIPEEAMRLWAPHGYVGDMAFPKPKEDARVLWESVHKDGMKWAEVAWFWRGKGGWLVSCVPATERLGVEPVAPHYLQALFDELVAKNSVAPTRKTVLVDFGPNPADGTNAVRHVAELLMQQGAEFAQVNYGAAGVRTLPKTEDAVFVVDAKGTNLSAKAKAFVQKVAGKGGRVLVLDMGRDEDPGWLKFLGIAWEKPLPTKMDAVPWNLAQTNEVDTSRHYFTHVGNAGAIAGLNNEDLFWWKSDQMWTMWRYLMGGWCPIFKWQKMEGEPVSSYLESVDADTRILTAPGAIAMKTVKDGRDGVSGAVVFGTFSLSKKDYGGDHPDKVYMTVKTLLNNLGARTSKVVMPSAFEFVDMKPHMNAAAWRKPGAEKLCFVPSAGLVDYRYFPVNRCGWSFAAQNFCPVEEFPSVPLCYDGVYFQFVNPETNDGKDVLYKLHDKDGVDVIRLPKATKVKRLHFLGFGTWPKGADLFFGDQKVPVRMLGNDHVGNWANNSGNVKSGKKVFSGIWDVPHAQRGEKYKPGEAYVFHWFVDNPEPEKPIDKITLGPGLGYFAITIER